jgi:hypothetical protein
MWLMPSPKGIQTTIIWNNITFNIQEMFDLNKGIIS